MGFDEPSSGGSGGSSTSVTSVAGSDDTRYSGLDGDGETLYSFAAAGSTDSFDRIIGFVGGRGFNESGSGGYPGVGVRLVANGVTLLDAADEFDTKIQFDVSNFRKKWVVPGFTRSDLPAQDDLDDVQPTLELYDRQGGGGSNDIVDEVRVSLALVSE